MILNKILFIDIETVGCCATFDLLSPRLKFLWEKKTKQINQEENASMFFNKKAGIYSEFGKIITIVIGYLQCKENDTFILRTNSFYGDNEKTLLNNFIKLFTDKEVNKKYIFCGHNIKEFDIPYLCRRLIVNNINLPTILNLSNKKPWEIEHIDTMELWSFGDRKSYTSLELLASIFNIPSSKDSIDGSMVHDEYYFNNGLEKIKNYCIQDIRVTAQIFLRLKNICNTSEIILQKNEEN